MEKGACHAGRNEARLGGLFLVENKQKQIPRADYRKVFQWRSAPRFARDDIVGVFLISLLG
jgi:hypothetical protein